MERLKARDAIYNAAMETQTAFETNRKRRTIRVDPLRRQIGAKVNLLNRMASDARFNGDLARARDLLSRSDELANLLYTLNVYGGYNSRMWRAFGHLEYGLKIPRMLAEMDKKHHTKHYTKLLRLLDWSFEGTGLEYQPAPRLYYGAPPLEEDAPSEQEMARARRIHDLYAKVLGV